MARWTWKRAVSIAALAAGAPGLAMAQTPPSASDDSEIIVTARKVEERLTDVPAAGQVIGAQQMQSLVLDKVDDYIRQIPSATVVSSGPEYLTDISIRGQGAGRNGFSESAVGIYRNGIYVAGGGFGGRSLNTLDLFDVVRVEVLRGPQGALYGRNAVGGAINAVSARPDLDSFSVQATGGYDDRERKSFQGVVNAPLMEDRLALRLGVIRFDQDGGFITDVVTRETLDTSFFGGLRGSAMMQFSPQWNAVLTYEYSDNHAPGFSVLGRRLDVAGRAERFDPNPFERNASRIGRVEINENTAFLEVNREGEAGTLTFVAAYKDRDGARFNEDLDHFLGFELVSGSDLTVRQDELYDRHGFEVRYASSPVNGRRFLIGADYQTYSDDVRTFNDGVTAVAALRELSTRTDRSVEDLQSLSAFGLYEFKIGGDWTFSAEARVQNDTKDFVFERIDRQPAPTNTSIAPLVSNRDWTQVLPTFTARYAFSNTNSLYARAASAYRPGGFNIGTGSVANLAYDPEKVQSLEAGWKGRLGRINLAAAAYHSWTDDLQVVTSVSTTDTTFVLVNVPSGKNWGAEIEASSAWSLGAGRVFLSGSLAHADGRFGDRSTVLVNGVSYNVSDQRIPRTRDYTATMLARYTAPLSDTIDGFFAISGSVEGGGYENAIGGLKIAGQSRSLASFDRLDLRAGFETERWRLSAYVQNLEDNVMMIQNISGNEYYTNGKIAGVQISMKFND